MTPPILRFAAREVGTLDHAQVTEAIETAVEIAHADLRAQFAVEPASLDAAALVLQLHAVGAIDDASAAESLCAIDDRGAFIPGLEVVEVREGVALVAIGGESEVGEGPREAHGDRAVESDAGHESTVRIFCAEGDVNHTSEVLTAVYGEGATS